MTAEAKLIKAILIAKGEFHITISGVSMMPILENGQSVRLVQKDTYNPGDILVYEYKNEGLLAHRLLKIENGRYFCKGDNSFRLEDLTADQILGKVDLEEDCNNTSEFIEVSLSLAKLFRKCRYDSEVLNTTQEYADYAAKYL